MAIHPTWIFSLFLKHHTHFNKLMNIFNIVFWKNTFNCSSEGSYLDWRLIISECNNFLTRTSKKGIILTQGVFQHDWTWFEIIQPVISFSWMWDEFWALAFRDFHHNSFLSYTWQRVSWVLLTMGFCNLIEVIRSIMK